MTSGSLPQGVFAHLGINLGGEGPPHPDTGLDALSSGVAGSQGHPTVSITDAVGDNQDTGHLEEHLSALEIEQLDSQIARLTAYRDHLLNSGNAGEHERRPMAKSQPGITRLFAEPDAIQTARASALAKEKSQGGKRTSIPDIIPGFKANSLEISMYISSGCLWQAAPYRQ
ncbi:hypothetical protein BU17DRAFT_68381 [Hysterangium stoloniferum]|nr:hypothetical protein BU17DRAFT_68381 [Hysterangium stoloniferum]